MCVPCPLLWLQITLPVDTPLILGHTPASEPLTSDCSKTRPGEPQQNPGPGILALSSPLDGLDQRLLFCCFGFPARLRKRQVNRSLHSLSGCMRLRGRGRACPGLVVTYRALVCSRVCHSKLFTSYHGNVEVHQVSGPVDIS
jgi:hypothetical protein